MDLAGKVSGVFRCLDTLYDNSFNSFKNHFSGFDWVQQHKIVSLFKIKAPGSSYQSQLLVLLKSKAKS